MAILICSYGESSSRKTTAMGRAAKYVYEKTGLPGRAVYSDIGNWQVIRPLVEAGIVEPFNISGEPELLALLRKLSRGYWPTGLKDGRPVERHPAPAGFKDPIGITMPKMSLDPQLGSKVGFYIWEGLTSTSELLMKYLRDYRINIKANEPLSPFKTKDLDSGQDMLFCANSMAHYGYVQDEMISTLLPELAALPVERVFITAHEAGGSDEGDKLPIRGPGLVGKAGTDRIGKNLGDVLHHEVYNEADPKDPKGLLVTKVRVYFKNHSDPRLLNTTYKCKTRLPEDQVAALEKIYPGGWFSVDKYDEFLAIYDGLLAKSSDNVAKWKQDLDKKRLDAANAAKEAAQA